MTAIKENKARKQKKMREETKSSLVVRKLVAWKEIRKEKQ